MPQRSPTPPSDDDGQVPEFSRALADLYERAGTPIYAELIRQAAAQRPPLRIADSSLSDWLTGVSVPSSPRVVEFLVSYLQGKAAQNGYQSRPPAWWQAQRDRAQDARRASRGGRPRTRTTSGGDNSAGHTAGAGEGGCLGRPIAEVDPFALEVHPAINADAEAARLGSLPAYVPRAHDRTLAGVVAEAQSGTSRLAVLVGGSSTGKTRALWEAIRELGEPWRLWHPIDPGRPRAALASLQKVGPHTVVWLNETQHYLLTADDTGEQVAAGLRELLRTPERGPVLVLGTLWPQYAWILSDVPRPGEPDPHAQARDLLESNKIEVPEAFTGPDLQMAELAGAASGDARLGSVS